MRMYSRIALLDMLCFYEIKRGTFSLKKKKSERLNGIKRLPLGRAGLANLRVTVPRASVQSI